MSQRELQAKEYWDQRYQKEGRIWGESVSRSVWIAIDHFGKNNAKNILIPGSGYGRHSRVFSMSGFKVTGLDISPVAVEMARQYDPQTNFYQGSALEMSFDNQKYDAIYGFNLMHLFLKNDRMALVQACAGKLIEYGLMFFTVFSEKETEFGKGLEVEKNTFETRPGRPAHYFTEEDLLAHFADYNVIDSGLLEESEDHNPGPHTHQLRYICVQV